MKFVSLLFPILALSLPAQCSFLNGGDKGSTSNEDQDPKYQLSKEDLYKKVSDSTLELIDELDLDDPTLRSTRPGGGPGGGGPGGGGGYDGPGGYVDDDDDGGNTNPDIEDIEFSEEEMGLYLLKMSAASNYYISTCYHGDIQGFDSEKNFYSYTTDISDLELPEEISDYLTEEMEEEVKFNTATVGFTSYVNLDDDEIITFLQLDLDGDTTDVTLKFLSDVIYNFEYNKIFDIDVYVSVTYETFEILSKATVENNKISTTNIEGLSTSNMVTYDYINLFHKLPTNKIVISDEDSDIYVAKFSRTIRTIFKVEESE